MGALAHSDRPASRAIHSSRRLTLGWVAALGIAIAPVPAAAEAPVLDIEGMTFVASNGEANELVLVSDSARFDTQQQLAFLEQVTAEVAAGGETEGFQMTCDRGVLNLNTNDFRFRGNVDGQTEDGRRFEAPWVRYVHEEALLYTDASVLITEPSGVRYRGGGFQYFVRERRFKLLGGAILEQEER